MKITVNIGFYTDGDFSFDYNRFKKDIKDLPEYNEICSLMDKIVLDKADFALSLSFSRKMSASDMLASFLTSTHVLYTHYEVLESLFNAFDGAISAVYNEENYFNSISGNYDGTFVNVIFDKEYKNE